MHKTQKELRQLLPRIDVFVEMLDARVPGSSSNPLLRSIRADKPCLKLLHKADLADPVATDEWIDYLNAVPAQQARPTDINTPSSWQHLPADCHAAAAPFRTRARADAPLLCLISGVPNVGKSTLINALAGRRVARTGNEPAVTRALQRIDIGQGVVLCDTPGLLWGNLEHVNTGLRLAITSAIKDTVIDYAELGVALAAYLQQHYPERLQTRYHGFEQGLPAGDPHSSPVPAEVEILDIIGRQRGCLGAGGHVDLDKAGRALVGDFRNGQLGRITLESPAQVEQEQQEVIEQRETRQAEKDARKEQRRRKKKS